MSKNLEDHALDGLHLPAAIVGRGRPPAHLVEQWQEVVEQIMGRGVSSSTMMARLIGVTQPTAARWMKAVRRKWAEGMSKGGLNWRREALYHEANEIAKLAWASALGTNNEVHRAKFMELVLKANDRKGRLCGLDNMRVEVLNKIESTTVIDVVHQVEASFELPAGALEALGKAASLALTDAARARLAEERPDLTFAGAGAVIDAVHVDPAELEHAYNETGGDDGLDAQAEGART